MVRWKSILSLFVLFVLLAGANLSPVFAQDAIRNLKISTIDTSEFPNIKVLLQALGPNNGSDHQFDPPIYYGK